MLWFKALHIIFSVAWFSGLFYLPRLFVYHATASDAISAARFSVMERKLYYIIMTPAGILTTLSGLWLFHLHFTDYVHPVWLYVKLLLVALLWGYQGCCGLWMRAFQQGRNHHGAVFFRIVNEIPTLMLIGIVIMAVVKPL